jgi:hypothetical protein
MPACGDCGDPGVAGEVELADAGGVVGDGAEVDGAVAVGGGVVAGRGAFGEVVPVDDVTPVAPVPGAVVVLPVLGTPPWPGPVAGPMTGCARMNDGADSVLAVEVAAEPAPDWMQPVTVTISAASVAGARC